MTGLAPPAGFVDTPHPPVAGPEKLVTRVEETIIDRPLAHVMASVAGTPLADTIAADTGLPGVRGTYVLAGGTFGEPGSRHMGFLTDGSTIVEQVLERVRNAREDRMRYVVWNYTSPTAAPLRYGLAEFHYTDAGDGRTRVRWTYSFELRRDRFPGVLGPLGGPLLKAAFLNGPYARWMRATLARIKANAEAWAA